MKYVALGIFALVSAGFAAGQEISPLLYGQNHWLAQGDEHRTGYLHLLWPKVKESGVTLVRLGGHAYEVTPPSIARWTAMVESVQAIGAEPLLQIPRQYTPEQAAALVTHFNHGSRRPVRYWSIGNEPMLNDPTTIEQVHDYVLRLAPAMKAVDPTIKILVYDEAWLRTDLYARLCGGDLDLTGKDANGHWIVDGFTFHSYPNGEKFERKDVTDTGVEKIRQMIVELLPLLEKADQRHGRAGDARLTWALTEVNVTYANPGRDVEGIGNPSFAGGQFIAQIFGLGMEYGALTVAPWAINETDDPKTDFGYLGLPPDFAPRSAYYHEQMLARNFRGHFVRSTANRPALKTIACRSANRICVLVMNTEVDQEMPLTIGLDRQAGAGAAALVNVDAGVSRTVNGTITPQTTMLWVFDATGRLIETMTYSVIDNLRWAPPTVKTAR